LLGRTSATLFDLRRDPATLFAPGDTIQFIAERHIDRATARIVGKTRTARKA
jgi:allophanate hydrolase subunit 1